MTGIECIETIQSSTTSPIDGVQFQDMQWESIISRPDEPLPEYMRRPLASATFNMMHSGGLSGVRPVFGRAKDIQSQRFVELNLACREALDNAKTLNDFQKVRELYAQGLKII